MNGLPPPKPIMMKERVSMLFLEYGELDVLDGTFVLIDKNGVRTQIPVGSVACLLLQPGTGSPCCSSIGSKGRMPSDLGW